MTEDWAWDLVTFLELVCSSRWPRAWECEASSGCHPPSPHRTCTDVYILSWALMIFAALMQDYQFYGLLLNDKLFVSLIFFLVVSPPYIEDCIPKMRGENSSSLIFIGFFLWWLPSIVCLTHPGRGWRTSKVKLACGRLVCRELSWLLTIVKRPSPLWVEASLGGLFKKARGRWARVWNSKPHAYTLQSSVWVWLAALTSPDDQLMTREMNWSLFYLCPGIFGPVVYQSKGHSVFSSSLLCWWKAHLFVSKAKHSSPVCFSVLWKPWLSLSSLTTLYTLVAPSSYT